MQTREGGRVRGSGAVAERVKIGKRKARRDRTGEWSEHPEREKGTWENKRDREGDGLY